MMEIRKRNIEKRKKHRDIEKDQIKEKHRSRKRNSDKERERNSERDRKKREVDVE